ncbi:GNVR domain-containing protein [Thalassobius sp. Cn5-15]|uniref:GNVR domain-containing protein n=1 Tax=Thalassobius sp. Cn5-15 TaxID=2917763 RepID=UPI001EF2678C|nr:GNVR domain-containing protein [Thalassobius sp. Cn5-15]MCG7494021.1 Wzz/FepE/Etk N-terminal domain-containing protein [Thalassobius sp. Cn5-15]
MTQPREDMVDIRETLAILRRQGRLILMTVLLLLTLAFVYVVRATPLYTATALVRIDPQETNLLDPEVAARSNAAVETSRLDTEVEILRSSRLGLQTIAERQLHKTEEFGPTVSLLDKARLAVGLELRRMPSPTQLTNQTLERFFDVLTVRRKGLTYLVAVSVTSADPDMAADLANTHARIYISDQVAARVEAAAMASEVLRNEVTKAERRLSVSNAALRVYVSDNLDRLTVEANSETLNVLSANFKTSVDRLAQAEDLLLQADGAFGRRNWEQLAAQIGDQSLQSLEEERQALRTRLQGSTLDHQKALDLESEIARLEADLEARAAASVAGLQGEVRQVRQDQDGVLDRIQKELTQAGLSAQTLTEVYALNQDALISQRQYDQMINRLRDFEAQAVVQVADSQLVAEALRPNSPSYPKPELVIGVALLLGLGLGVALALVKEFYFGGVTSANQLANVIGAKVGAVVPRVNGGTEGRTLADKVVVEQMSQFAEAFRKLRAGLDQGLGRRKDKVADVSATRGAVILVTSAIPAEGKSTSALSLARTYALAGKRTLLIDADLRKPSIHSFVKEEPEMGLLEYLQSYDLAQDLPPNPPQEPVGGTPKSLSAAAPGDPSEGRPQTATPAADAQFYVLDPLSKLGIILGGRRANVPTDAPLQSVAFRNLVENARGAFDIVVIDTAPLLPVVDTQYIAPMVDAAVVCVRFAESTQAELRTTMAHLRDALPEGAVVMGVLSCFEGGQQGGRYDGYYGG